MNSIPDHNEVFNEVPVVVFRLRQRCVQQLNAAGIDNLYLPFIRKLAERGARQHHVVGVQVVMPEMYRLQSVKRRTELPSIGQQEGACDGVALFLEKIRKSETVNPFLDIGNEGVRREIRQSKMRYSGVDEVRVVPGENP